MDALPGVVPDDLFYLDSAPFSARFYSHEDVRNKSMIQRLQARAEAIEGSQRYTVFRLIQDASRTAESDTVKKERQSG